MRHPSGAGRPGGVWVHVPSRTPRSSRRHSSPCSFRSCSRRWLHTCHM
ncbi:hypothetical protein SHJG_0448 [Streptomyces hygroscopicus subsp. jinggangensis 5008]|nr:hypothetical protein SHJG_0448 [Streptomyces hygroscopicus subsp. jinggangensis 5008]AGF59948.1 hypothetical protein SHJGH_0282 [Streptomyces hygroscopicus subsp. jinggangensis TL01]